MLVALVLVNHWLLMLLLPVRLQLAVLLLLLLAVIRCW
jgi:hypothetical protein